MRLASYRKWYYPESVARKSDSIKLGDAAKWRVEGRLRDASVVFRAMPILTLPQSYLRLEDGSYSKEVAEFVRKYDIKSMAQIEMGTVWPHPVVSHLPATNTVFEGLADLASRHAAPEICVHLHIYQPESVHVEWYDAFDDPVLISELIPEDSVQDFCDKVGCSYVRLVSSNE